MIGTRKQLRVIEHDISYLEEPGATLEEPTILFLHGWGGSAESFQPLWQELRAQSNTGNYIALDFPGFGQSSSLHTPWTVADYARCVIAFMDALGIATAHIVSHSFGGRVTTLLLSEYPERFDTIVYIAAAGIRHENIRHTTIQRSARLLKRLFQLPLLRFFFPPLRAFGYKVIHGQDYAETSGVMQKTFQQVVAQDLRPYLSTITHPVSIFWGEHDSYVPVQDAKDMHALIPGSHVTIFPDGKHGIHKTHARDIAISIQPLLT